MPESQLHFVVPLPFAWTDTKQPDSVAEITFTPADGTPFEFTPMGGVLGDNGSAFSENTVQWRVKHGGTVPVTTSLKQAGQSTTATLSVQFAEPRPLEIDFAEVQQANGGNRHVLLRGSVRIPLSLNAQDLSDDFQKSLAALWPVAGDQQIVALRLEPAGLYLEGKLPAAMFPRGIAADGEVTVVLRVPQQEWDTADGKRFWTLESFDFGNELPSAREFLLGYAEDLDGFNKPDRKTFIDNVAASPVAETAVRISRLTDDELVWAVSGSRVLQPKADELKRELPALRQQLRIQFGGGEAGEAAFHPDELTGKVKENNRAWKRIPFGANGGEGHHVLVRTKRTEAEPAAESAVALGMSSDTPKLVLTQQRLAALSLPTLPLKPPVRDDAQPDDKPPARGRSWLCTDQGWLAVDAAPAPKGAGAGGGRGAGAIQGVIELEKIMAYLKEPPEQGGAGGQQAGQALAEEESRAQETLPDALLVQLATLDTTSVVLGIDYDDQTTMVGGVHLFLGDPLTTVITPSVWYAAPSSDQAGAVGAQLSTAELLPALSVAQDASPLESMFEKASFISPDPDKETPSDAISAVITWGANDGQEPHFSLRLQAAQLRLWHPIPDVPLAQSFSRTPDPSRDSTLDANRGLIPFEPPAGKPVTLEFRNLPAVGLPSVDGAPKAKDDLGGWTIPASRFPTRYFLPTLPGVEATLPVKPKTEGEAPETGLRWGYRHAVPTLDEAYAEVVEDPAQKVDAVQIQGGLDFTRVEGAEAFEIRAGDDLKATGWLRKTKDNPGGETKIEIQNFNTDFKPEGRDPHLTISLVGLTPTTVTFDRDKNAAGLTGRFGNGQEIANNGQSLGVDGATTHDGEGLELDEITGPETTLTRLGQSETRITGTYTYSPPNPDPKDALTLELMGVRIGEFAEGADLSDQRWMLHDGNGDWPSLHGWPLYPVKLTELRDNGISPSAAVIEVVLLPRVPAPPVLSLEPNMLKGGFPANASGTNLDGSFRLDLPVHTVSIELPMGRWPFYPPHVSMWDIHEKPVDIRVDLFLEPEENPDTLHILVSVVNQVAPREITIRLHTDVPDLSDDSPVEAGGRLLLTLSLAETKIVDISVESVAGQDGFDWCFQPAPLSDVSLLRLRGSINVLKDLGPDGSSMITSLVLKHPLGVIDLGPALNQKTFNFSGTTKLSGKLPAFICELEVDSAEPFRWTYSPPWIWQCTLKWLYRLPDGVVVQLLHSTEPTLEDLMPCDHARWSLRVFGQSGRTLVGPLCLKAPITVDKHRFLFEVDDTQAVPDSGDSRAWLRTKKVTGCIGVEFSKERLEIKSLTADIQVSMGDRYPNDAVVLWDPVKQTLHTMGRNVGALGRGVFVPPTAEGESMHWFTIGPATVRRQDDLGPSHLVYWVDSEGAIRRWRLGQENRVFRHPKEGLGMFALLPADLNSTLAGIGVMDYKLSALRVSGDALESTGISEGNPNAPITAAATAIPWKGERIAWWTDQGPGGFLATWRTGDDGIRSSDFQDANVRDMAFLDEDTLLTADDNGRLFRWELAGDDEGELQPGIVTEEMGITSMVVVERNRRLVTAHADGTLWLREVSNPIGESKQFFSPTSTTEFKVISLQPLPDRRSIEDKKVRFAVLYDDNSVRQFEYAESSALDQIEVRSKSIDAGDCSPRQMGTFWDANSEYMLLALAGPSTSSRLAAHLHIDVDGLLVALTGRLTIQNNLDYVVKEPHHPTLEPRCTHRIDLYFDRAAVPAEAIFWGKHHAPEDSRTAALAHHVFRFPDGHERIWQAPQMVRFTSLKRFAPLAGIQPPADRGDDLVLDASAVFWLQPAIWAESMRYGVGAAAIANDDFRLWLLPRELRSFETGLARAVRLPAVTCWAFDNAPFEVRTSDAIPAPRIIIQKGNEDPSLTYWTSGVQRLLESPGAPGEGDGPIYFARGTEAPWLDAGFLHERLHRPAGGVQPGVRPAFEHGGSPTPSLKDRETLNDLLWLRDQLGLWLHEHVRLYCLEHEADTAPDPIALLANTSTQLGRWRATPQGRTDPDDIVKFRSFLKEPGQQAVDGFATWLEEKFEDPKYNAQYTDFIRGDSAFLASATLAHVHDLAQAPQALAGPALFEYPYRLRLEELSGKPVAGKKFDVQLLVFDKEGSLKRVAHEHLAPEEATISGTDGDQEDAAANGTDVDQGEAWNRAAQDRAAEKWARGLMEQRRRHDAAFVLVDFARLIPVPRRFEAAYEDLPFALDAPLGGAAEETADPRRRLPGLQRIGASWQRTWLQADPTLGLRVFAAEPAAPTDKSQKIVAATRFRLARAGGDSHLASALVEPFASAGGPAGDPATTAQPQIVALSQRDDVPFEVQSAQGYPLHEGRKLIGQPAPTPANLVKLRPAPTQEDGQPASLLPPLVDIVSWAARPGEMTRSSWSADIHEVRDAVGDPGLQAVASRTRHPVSVSLRRPRARAGQQEAVRLLLKKDRSASLLQDRFRQAEFLLQQDIERTSRDELGERGIQIVVVTRTDVYKSSTDLNKARSNPAQIYSTSDATVYLVVNNSFLDKVPQNNDDNDHLVLRVLPADSGMEQFEKTETTKKYFDPAAGEQLPVVLWRNDKEDFKQENVENLSHRALKLTEGGGLLAVVHYKQTPPEQEGEDPTPHQPDLYAALDVKVLNQAGRFIPPKMSISLLCWPQSGDAKVALAGYGRLGPEDFSLIEPRADGDGLAWSRTARLQVIHRSVPDQNLPDPNYDYDVVAYGPGGELIRTEAPEPS